MSACEKKPGPLPDLMAIIAPPGAQLAPVRPTWRQEQRKNATAQASADLHQQRIARIDELLTTIPALYRDCALDPALARQRAKRPQAIQEAWGLWKKGALTISLMGQAGDGKSVIAAGFFGHFATKAKAGDRDAEAVIADACWFSALRLARARQVHGLGRGEPKEIKRAMSCSVLFLDELGQETTDPTGSLIDIIFQRVEDKKRTVLTTGLTKSQIMSRYGEGLWRRLSDENLCGVVHCGELPVEKPMAKERV